MIGSLLFAAGGILLIFGILGYIAWVAGSVPLEKPKEKE